MSGSSAVSTLIQRIRLFICVGLMLAAPCSGVTEGVDRSVIGKWRLTEVRDAASIASRDEKEAKKLLGRIFIIQSHKVQFDDEVCQASDFEAQEVDIRLFLPQEFRASHENLGLPNPATAVDLSCTTVFIKNKNKLLIFWDGWFFDAVRIR